jgi:hypothetical protein
VNRRRLVAAIFAAALVVPALLGASQLFGWGTGPSDAKDPDAAAIRAFVAFLDTVHGQTFTAWYTTGAGVSVTHAQEPPRQAYRSASGVYVAGPDASYLCRTADGEQPRCDRGAGVDDVELTAARAMIGVLDERFVAPPLVSAYLSRVAGSRPGTVARSQRVVGGQNTDCIAIVRLFTACATRGGVLAYFDSPDARLTLTGFQPTVTQELFALPRGAAIVDAAAAEDTTGGGTVQLPPSAATAARTPPGPGTSAGPGRR